jgi:voltage-gated potassium channel
MGQAKQYSSLFWALAVEVLRRLRLPFSLLAGSMAAGTTGFRFIGEGRWTWLDCAYMTSITLTTVGFGEILEPMTPGARFFAMALMWVGMGVTLYAISAVTAFIVEQHLTNFFKERKMEIALRQLSGHFIVCGAGQVGRHVAVEIVTSGRRVVMVDDDPARLAALAETSPDLLTVLGDATEEEGLKKVGLARAKGMVAVLRDDSQNMLVTVQARYVNPKLTICTRCRHENLAEKFYRAGADYVVNPDFIGGMRIASQIIRPQVVSFLDRMLKSKVNGTRVEEVTIREGSPLLGRTLAQANLRERTGLAPVALRRTGDADFVYNPRPEEELTLGSVLIVIADPEQAARMRSLCGA